MSKDTFQKTSNAPALEFKSSSFSVPVIILSTNVLSSIEAHLQEKVRLAPEFFNGSPVIIDVQELDKQNLKFELSALMQLIRKLKFIPVGIRGGNAEINKTALELCIPVYPAFIAHAAQEKPEPKTSVPQLPLEKSTTLLVTQPVRSGQRIYSAGDLVILACVSAGAEILAEGSIHIYNVLRGRALAGIKGDVNARIYCSDLRAELISIAGTYKISEDIIVPLPRKPLQIYLQKNSLMIENL